MATAEIYDAELNPTKPELVRQFSDITELLGSYRAVDPEGQVGIEVHIGSTGDSRLGQLAVTYRDHEVEHQITTMEHSVLGTRYISYATSDPVAVAEFIRMILSGDTGAEYSDGQPLFDVHGTGHNSSLTVDDVKVSSHTINLSKGTVTIDGEDHEYTLEFPLELNPLPQGITGLVAVNPDNGQEFAAAVLTI